MADGGEKLGLNAAVQKVAVDLGRPLGTPAVQLPLLSGAHAGEQLDGDPPAAGEAVERRGPGRPPGSTNRRTDEWTDFILNRYTSPLIALAETYSRSVAELAADLGCTRKDALQIQIAAAKELAPYLHQKQPVAVSVDAHGVVTLMIADSTQMSARVPGDAAVIIEGQVLNDGDEAEPSKFNELGDQG